MRAPDRIFGGYVLLLGAARTLRELKRLCRLVYLTDKPLGARIVATNPDAHCPTPDGGLPDCAFMLAAVEASTGARAEALVGKPSEHMAATLLERLGVPQRETLLVGDRLATDIRVAKTAGMASALVFAGATGADEALSSPDEPDYVLEDLTELLPAARTQGRRDERSQGV